MIEKKKYSQRKKNINMDLKYTEKCMDISNASRRSNDVTFLLDFIFHTDSHISANGPDIVNKNSKAKRYFLWIYL